MKKLIYLLALIIPLSAQEADVKKELDDVKEEAKETVTETHKFPSRKSFGKRVWMGVQDAEWRKFDAAHKRAHSKRGEQYSARESMGDKRQKIQKKQQIKNIVRLAVVGGLAYYIGYHQGEEHFKGGWNKRKYDWGDRK